ncbi:MAG: MqnA/MqnD/SBP family protein [Bacteroidota bacterium]
MSQSFQIGAWDAFALQPLLEGLAGRKEFTLSRDVPAHTAFHLRDRLDRIGFLSPIDLAKESSNFFVIPEIGLWSNGGGGTVTVHFRADLDDIETMAVDPAYPTEIVLAKIVLSEEFGINPQFVPVSGDIDTMLGHADAALLVGDAALRESAFHPHALDLTESWVQMTDLPFVHGLWCAREEDLTPALIETLLQARRSDPDSLAAIASRAVLEKRFPGFSAENLLDYLETFFYDLPEEALDGMTEFFRFAYYHGILPDIPEIQFFSGHGAADDDSPLASERN